jgi:TrmH family RNA methyltransferase
MGAGRWRGSAGPRTYDAGVVEIRDRAAAVRLVRDLGADEAALQASELLLGDAAGPVQVLASGWRRTEGVLVLGAPLAPGGDRPAVVVAANERALRNLLLALPRGERLALRVGRDWHLGTVAEMLDGARAPDGACFTGVKRGGRETTRAAAAGSGGDPVLGRGDVLVDLVRDLAQPAGRARHGRFVAEGPTLVGRAVDDGLPVDSVVYTADLVRSREESGLLERARSAGILCARASSGQLGTLTPTRPLPAVLATVHLRIRDASELAPDRASVVLVAEDLQNPDNLGMVLRTADAAGVEAVVVAGATTDPLHRNSVRAARGAVGRIPIFRAGDLTAWAFRARELGFRVVGATGSGEVGLFDADLAPPVAIVVGNEEVGLGPETLAACTERVAIPMAPGQDSLNVGVAAGVMLYEVVRRRAAG